MRVLDDMDISGKKVLIRVDFNVPIKKGKVEDSQRIEKTIPTLKKILEKQAKQIIIITHLGRPKGEVKDELKIDPVAEKLEELIGEKVIKLDDCVDVTIPESTETKIILLENLRFHKEEKENNSDFAEKISKCADVFVNDAFGTCHRAHASVEAITKFLPSCAGLLVEKEIKIIEKALENPEKPFIAIMGGVKVSDKIEVIQTLLKKVDCLLIGGAMCFTFLKSTGVNIQKSIVEDDKLELAEKLLENSNNKIVLPIDIVSADSLENPGKTSQTSVDELPENKIGLDIGEETIEAYKEIILKAKTIIWNGPLGAFETKPFDKSTNEIAKAIAQATKENKAISIIGGGDVAAAVKDSRVEDQITHISTGGGAFLELISGKKLPGIEALK